MAERRLTGRKVDLLVFDGNYVHVMGVTNIAIAEPTAEITAPDSESDGNPNPLLGDDTRSLTVDVSVYQNDRGFAFLKRAKREHQFFKAAIRTRWDDGQVDMEGGEVGCTNITRAMPQGGVITASITLTGKGAWQEIAA
jgi:hypothetical protein